MRLGAIVLDCANAEELAGFYERFLGWLKCSQEYEGETWWVVVNEKGEGTPLVFQEVSGYERPVWPPKPGQPQQMMHLDFYVKPNESEEAVAQAIACGATPAEEQLSDGWTVMLDPAGHPFCIIPVPEECP